MAKMKEEELKYTLRLLDHLTQDIYEEVLQFYYNIEESKPCKELSNELLEFLKHNFKTNPVTTATIINFIQNHLTGDDSILNKLQNIYLDIVKTELSESNCPDRLTTLLSLVKWSDSLLPQFTEHVLKRVSGESLKHYRRQILISLIPQDKPELLKIASDFMQQSEPQREFKLTPEYMLELCYQDKTHWLLKAADIYKEQLHDLKNVTFNINNFTKQILIMVLIDLTNSPETYDLPSLVQQLTNIFSILDTYTTADEQLQFYLTEVKRELTLIKFCLENNCKILTTSIFSQILAQSALAVMSQVCRLSKVDRYKVSRLLNTNRDFIVELTALSNKTGLKSPDDSGGNWDIMTYSSFCAITKIIDIIFDSSTSLDEIKRLVLSIQPIHSCIEVIENIFSCLFLRYEYFSCNEHNQDSLCGTHSECSYFYSKKQNRSPKSFKSSNSGFMCNSLTTQIILNTLKICLETLEGNLKADDVDPSAVARYKNLVKVVNHSIWKLQLVSSLSPDTSPLQLKLCLDYVEMDESSEDEDREVDLKVTRKKPKVRRRQASLKPDNHQLMVTSTISASDDMYSAPKVNSIDFISIMLAKPNSLVALALYHNDFSKANQILEMFDLADSEIATEVTFTKQLHNLVAKIKNIIYYRDDTRYPTKELSALSVVSTEVMGLVEGFLASNRAPNSIDIIELASRHPHLQLYSHQNAPLINAVDILLSSGLNREITYGLINVVERKLAEVRSATDVAAVKKTNYIRFVEDIASVAFEIFGDTEKSFDFVDNICGLITDCRIPIKHKEFCKLNQLSKELRQSCEDLTDIVNSSVTELDPTLLQKYHQIYMNIVTASDKDVCNVSEVSHNALKKTRTHYLRMCYMYCKTVAQLEQDESQTEPPQNVSYFSVMEKPLHDIFGNMINNKEVPVTSLEPICKKLNVNLIPKLILNFCPSIILSPHKEATEENFNHLLQAVYEFTNPEENLFIEPEANFAPLVQTPDPQCLTYIVLHNWVLAHIIKKIHISPNENSLQQSIDARTKCLNNFMELPRFNCTKTLFGNNKYLASLHSTIDLDLLFAHMPQLISSGKILKCLNIIDSLSESQLMSSANLMNLRDLILFKLATNPKMVQNWKYCQYLKCPELKMDLVLNNLNSWPAEGAFEVLDYLRFLLDKNSLDDELYATCSDWMVKIPIYDQIAPIMGTGHWHSIFEKSVENPENVIEVLMDNQQFKLCLEWADAHEVSEHMTNLIVTSLLRQLFEHTSQATSTLIQELLCRLPTTQAMDLIQEEMSKVRNVEILQVCVDFISENSSDWKSFENIKIGLQIMLEIDNNLRNVFWELIEKPLLMIEQFLMNGKLELLANIINKISPSLKKDPTGDNLYYNIKSIETLVISRNAVDALLRFYAEKALDMKNPSNRVPLPPKPISDDALLQSIDSINIEDASRPFVMPEQVPTKEQWTEDYATDRCMLCHTSIFSMIMRRHHCRRCGRLVCHACSRRRMTVPTYPSGVKFRVCDDCHTQTMNKKSTSNADNLLLSSNSDSAGSGVTCMDWCLSTNSRKNEAVRTEFSYEFTPNVTLCLTIMKMHAINLDYPRFLLDRADEVARALSGGGDARLLVRARRSLLLAAIELYSRTPNDNGGAARVAETGAAHAGRCLAHADAMATLVRHQAHHLVPRQGAHPSQIVRSLLEAEKWDLALEIATKSGLPRTSVLAAWGKACLKAGCFRQAREKFAYCFKSTVCVEEDCEFGREAREDTLVNKRLQSVRYSERSSSMSSVQSDGRPRANPPLLNEVISILEDMNYPVNQQLLAKAENMKTSNEKVIMMNISKKKIPLAEPALNIMHTLAYVKKIKQGDYSDFQTATVQPKKSLAQGLLRRNNNHNEPKVDHQNKRLDPFFYKECVYYLTNYGSHVANIAFFMKHSNLTEVLRYCYDNLVDKETFTEAVYMECLKKEKVNDLLKAMTDMDNSLEMWGEYIMHICRTLEMSKRLDALYQVQCGSGQHARASATCALLYARRVLAPPAPPAPPAAPARALRDRQHHLATALHHLGQCVPSTKVNDPKSLNFHLDKQTIDNLMTTMTRQIEVAKYLAAAETSGRLTEKVLSDVIPLQRREDTSDMRPLTLFGSNTDKIRLVAVILAVGQTMEVGFELAFKIITEHKLDSMNIYSHVSRYLVQTDRFMEVKALAKCIRTSKETAANLMSDQVLESGVSAVVARCQARGQLHDEQAELLICDVHSVGIKISCYLVCRNLTSAYILAARHDGTNYLRRVLQEAERLGNDQIRNACLKRCTSNLPTSP